jgi:hypothetical protein
LRPSSESSGDEFFLFREVLGQPRDRVLLEGRRPLDPVAEAEGPSPAVIVPDQLNAVTSLSGSSQRHL